MNNHVLFSVIIPFYGGENYIQQAVESVLDQPYKYIEIILVNDGSPTGADKCEYLANLDKRIKYYVKNNEGTGAARNYGIKKASGDWLAFLDQDDVWTRDFLTDDVVKRLGKNDVVGFSHYCCNNDFTRGNLIKVEERCISGGGEAAQTCSKHHSSFFYSRKLLENTDIRYALTRHEDVIFLQKALYMAERITFIDKVMFLYRNNFSSQTHQYQKVSSIYGPLLKSWRELLSWHLENHSTDVHTIKTIKHMICVYAIEAVEMLYRTGMKEEDAEPVIDRYFCRDFLDNYKTMLLSENRIKEIGFYYEHRQAFIKEQRRIGKRQNIRMKLRNSRFLQAMNDRKKYKSVIPKGIYTT